MKNTLKLSKPLPPGFSLPDGFTDERLLRFMCQRSFLAFCMAVKPDFVPTRFHIYLAEKFQQIYEDTKNKIDRRYIIACPPQLGKLLAHSTPVLTTKGWTTHGKLKIGDYVFGRDGKPKKVMALSEEDFTDFDIGFTDGEIIKCHSKHEWLVTDRKVLRGHEKVIEAGVLYNENLSAEGGIGKRGNRYRFQIDENIPVSFSKKKLPLHPYILGAWLGDGKSSGCTICAGAEDIEVIEKVKSLGFSVSSSWKQKNTGVNYFYFKGLQGLLRKLNLINNKHIPEQYLIASTEQRLELLAGLIDTDGTVYHKNGRVTFANINANLIEQVRKLVLSLGWRVTITKIEPCLSTSGIQGRKPCYQLSFNPDIQIPLVIPRKKLVNINPLKRRRAIKSIKKTLSPELGRCIQVEGGIYLAGRTLIPTHNSTITTQLFPAWVLGKQNWPVICASYSADLAERNSLFCRDIVSSDTYKVIFPSVRLNPDSTSKSYWQTNRGGSYRAVGTLGGLTGYSGRLLLGDDLLASQAEADSATISDGVWSWFKTVFYTRKQSKSAMVLIATRWSLNDPTGRLLDQQVQYEEMGLPEGSYDKWDYLSFPAIADQDEDFGDGWTRKAGEVICPERFTLEDMIKTRNSLISEGKVQEWSSLYQQEPILQENAAFKNEWFRFFESEQIKDLDLINFTLVDLASSKKKGADNVVVMTVGKDRNGPNWYVLEYTSGNSSVLDPAKTIDAIFDHHSRYKSTVWIESVGYQAALETFVLEEQRKREIYFTVNQIKNASARKVDRITGLVPFFKNGVILMRKNMIQLQTELLQFPKGKHDDHPDTLSFLLSVKSLTVFAKQEEKKADTSYTSMWRKRQGINQDFNPHKSFTSIT